MGIISEISSIAVDETKKLYNSLKTDAPLSKYKIVDLVCKVVIVAVFIIFAVIASLFFIVQFVVKTISGMFFSKRENYNNYE